MRAAQKYEEALKIEPDKIAALDDWGHVLFYLAQATSGKQADQLWTQAAEKFEAIVRLDPKDCDALTNGAMVLLKHSLIKTVEEADRMWTLAAEKCKAALKLKPEIIRRFTIGASHYSCELTIRSRKRQSDFTSLQTRN
jgi:tetratricopeptide (TPR) repeat protein